MQYKELKELLKEANNYYYNKNTSIMSDYEFDQKLKELEKMEKLQGFADSDSPTQSPGSDLGERTQFEHLRPMASLQNSYSIEEVEKWYMGLQNFGMGQNPEVVVNPKWDGMSGALRFKNGFLYRALTRGDGSKGEDITQNLQYCSENLWPKKAFLGLPFTGEARGEIIMRKDFFKEFNKNGVYQNARNLVAGTCKLLDIYEFMPRASGIEFYAYWLEDSENTRYSDDLATLERYGFTVGPYFICKSIEEIHAAIEKIETLSRGELPCEIDGAVLKVNEKAFWKNIGSTAKFPKYCLAYKYKQETAETTVTKIEYRVGRTGKITGLCYFEPVLIDGSTISKATLNNKEWQDCLDIAVGDTIEVQKAAAIIPQIVNVLEKPYNRVKVPFPVICPSCGSKLKKRNEDQVDYFCENPSCKGKLIATISNFTHIMEIDGFADIIIGRLINASLLNGIASLYNLKDHQAKMSTLERFSTTIAAKLVENIERSKKESFWKVVAALNIPGVSTKMAKLITQTFTSIEKLENATIISLTSVDGVAKKTAEGIISFFKNNKELVNSLKSAGLQMRSESVKTTTMPLSGKSFCITGALSKPRKEYEEMIESLGGKNVGAVTSNTTYLVTNTPESSSSKNKKARELGTTVISEEELLRLLNEN